MSSAFDTNLDVQDVAIADLRPNDWNPNTIDAKILAKLRNQIKSKGFIHPIIVRPALDEAEQPYFEIVDGYHRWTIMKELGAESIPAVVKTMSDADAKIHTLNANYMRGNPVPVKLAALIHDLNKEYTISDLENMLPYDTVELNDNLELLKLPPDIDRISKEAVGTNERMEPVFISATIYKEVEKGIHEFVQEALLEAEATFAEIKVKIEAGDTKRDEVINAIQNLKQLDTGADFTAGEEAPIVTRFAVYDDQFQVIDQALQHMIKRADLTKNARGRALELIMAEYLAGAQPLD